MGQITKEGGAQPFAQQFMEPIASEEMLDASGHYNPESQTWIFDNPDSSSPPALMTGLNPDRAPTTCQKMTKIGDKHYQTDYFNDD